jgi:Glycosyltransferase family 87
MAIGSFGLALACWLASTVAGSSSATPGLGPRTALPPYDLGLHPSDLTVTVLLVLGYLFGGVTVWAGMLAIRAGWTPRPGRVAVAVAVVALVTVLVPPSGSADHLSYAAYGRTAALGGDPYVVPPDAWPRPDPVIGAAEPPWADTPDVYGPIATALYAGVSLLAGSSLRATVWFWQLLVAAAFLLTSLLLHLMARGDRRLQARAAVLWTLNPLLIEELVGGAHLDAVSTAAAICCLWLATSPRSGPGRYLLAGVALGLAAGTKFPYALAGLAVLWAVRGRGARYLAYRLPAGLVGVLAVLLPGYLWSGRHTFDQARVASHYVSLATPWHGVVSGLQAITGPGVRDYVPLAFAGLACLVVAAGALLLHRWDQQRDRHPGQPPVSEPVSACRALLVLSLAYPLAAPYVLPWYDGILWAPLCLIAVPALLESLLLIRLVTLAVAYVPGRGDAARSTVIEVMLDVRQFAAPVVVTGVLGWILTSGLRRNSTVRPTTTSPRTVIATVSSQSGEPQSQDH